MKTCIRPSSSSCRTASSKRLCRTSAGRRYANRSAGNCGIGGYRTCSPAVERVADGQAAGVDEPDDVARVTPPARFRDRGRRTGRRATAAAVVPSRALTTAMSFARRPEQMRRNATRSRWRGFMFAWILKTNPEKSGSVGRITPASLLRGAGTWRERQQRVKKRLDAEVVQRAAEEDRRLPFLAIRLQIEPRARALRSSLAASINRC